MDSVNDTAFGVVSLCSTQPEPPYRVALGVHVSQPCRNRKGGTGCSHCHRAWEEQASREVLGQLGALGSKGCALVLGAVGPITAAWSRGEGWAACSRGCLSPRWSAWTASPSVSAAGLHSELLFHSGQPHPRLVLRGAFPSPFSPLM